MDNRNHLKHGPGSRSVRMIRAPAHEAEGYPAEIPVKIPTKLNVLKRVKEDVYLWNSSRSGN